MNRVFLMLALVCAAVCGSGFCLDNAIVYEGKDGPGKGKHIVFLTGDEEYRSEEGLPMLAKILSQRHGFKCTVLFAINAADGTINPNEPTNLPGLETLATADLMVNQWRFRSPSEADMKHLADYVNSGKPVIGLRTATHAFQMKNKDSAYASWHWTNKGGFGRKILGETWVNHWGNHMKEATRGVIEPAAKDDAVLRGVTDIFGDTDVYEAYPPEDARILVRGQVLKGMGHDDPPADYQKKSAKTQQMQGVNSPMMPVAWTREVKTDAGKTNRVFCTTMGAATDLQSEGLRRLLVNAAFWGMNMDIPEKANVDYVGEFKPSAYRGGGFKKGVKPADLAITEGK